MDSRCSSSADSRLTARRLGSVNTTPICARVESYESGDKKCISDVRRTFCLFVTFDLLFITLLWIIELNVNGGIQKQLDKEVLHYDYRASFFDIFLLAVFRFATLILAYAVCKLRHWWAIAITTATSCAFLIVKVILSKLLSQGAFGYLLPIISFVLAWIETWLLDFKVLPQEPKTKTDICPSWTPQSELLSWAQVLYLTDSSTRRQSPWQTLMRTWMINTIQKKGSFSR
uniref:STARD3 N-terminal like n=1 Tax=Labrus bergylta TaxID=56723 RepID=A0A3Q3GC81_9LABR